MRVWQSLLEEISRTDYRREILILDRNGTAPRIQGVKYLCIEPYGYDRVDRDREMLQNNCNEEEADVFMSTYYTTPLETPSVFLVHDMIPEIFDWNLDHPMWKEKHRCIDHAGQFICVSQNTTRDLIHFFPRIPEEVVTVAYPGVSASFSPASLEEVESFKRHYKLNHPYFLLVGHRVGYKNQILFFKALATMENRFPIDVVCVGSRSDIEDEFKPYIRDIRVHMLRMTDDELRAAYSGAIALSFPSKYEGFGLPAAEAMACGCPVITCRIASLPEVVGRAALFVNPDDVSEMKKALEDVTTPNVRQVLIARGLEQARKFSWSSMAFRLCSVLQSCSPPQTS